MCQGVPQQDVAYTQIAGCFRTVMLFLKIKRHSLYDGPLARPARLYPSKSLQRGLLAKPACNKSRSADAFWVCCRVSWSRPKAGSVLNQFQIRNNGHCCCLYGPWVYLRRRFHLGVAFPAQPGLRLKKRALPAQYLAMAGPVTAELAGRGTSCHQRT